MRVNVFSILVLTGIASIAGCAGQLSVAHAGAPEAEAVTYAGTIPCASCPGIHIVLTLFPDSTFRLRQTYLEAEDGQDQGSCDLGRWTRTADDRLQLHGGTEVTQQFRFLPEGLLRMLDTEGNEIQSEFNYDLTRQPTIDPVSGPCGANNSSWSASTASGAAKLASERHDIKTGYAASQALK